MDIDYFRYIMETAEIGSISKAANKLFISQSYLSRIIQEIEYEFKIIIFIRTNRGVTLTKEGKEFINYAKQIVDTYNKICNLKEFEEEETLELNITSIRSSIVMEAFMEFERKLETSRARFRIRESNNSSAIRDIYYLRSDLGVILLESGEKESTVKQLKKMDLKYQKICNFTAHIVVRKGHPLANRSYVELDDLEGYGFVRYNTESFLENEKDGLISFTDYTSFFEVVTAERVIEVDDRGSLHNIVNNTDYFFVGTSATKRQEEIFGIVSVPIRGESIYPALELGVIYHEKIEMKEEAKEFIEVLHDISNSKPITK